MLYDDDKRAFLRMMINSEAHLKVIQHDKEFELTAICRDLSATGMLLEVNEPIEPDATVKVKLESANQAVPPLEALTRVVRCTQEGNDHYAVGIEMLDIN